MQKKETKLQKEIKKALKRNVGGFWIKIHGGPFQKAGMPDLLGCVCGRFFALEVKRKEQYKIDDVQIMTIKLIQMAGGFATIVFTPYQAVKYVKTCLRNENIKLNTLPLPEPGDKIWFESKRRGFIYGAGLWKNPRGFSNFIKAMAKRPNKKRPRYMS